MRKFFGWITCLSVIGTLVLFSPIITQAKQVSPISRHIGPNSRHIGPNSRHIGPNGVHVTFDGTH